MTAAQLSGYTYWRSCRDVESEAGKLRQSAVVWRLRNRNNSQQTEWLLPRLEW